MLRMSGCLVRTPSIGMTLKRVLEVGIERVAC